MIYVTYINFTTAVYIQDSPFEFSDVWTLSRSPLAFTKVSEWVALQGKQEYTSPLA